MTVSELHTLLKSTGYPVAFYEFKKKPTLPFIVYIVPSEQAWGDDFNNYIISKDISVEIYTSKKDFAAEEKLEKILNFVEYNKNTTFIKGKTQDDNMFQATYEFNLVEKI